jgi:hypothetical protein
LIGRTNEQKRNLFQHVAARAVRADDIMITLTENAKMDWSLGLGVADRAGQVVRSKTGDWVQDVNSDLRVQRARAREMGAANASIVLKAAQEKFLSALQAVSGIVERRHTLPILANVLVRKNGGTTQPLYDSCKGARRVHLPSRQRGRK